MPQAANHGLVLDPEALYRALDAHRRKIQRESGMKGRMSWRRVALDINVSFSAFQRVGVGWRNLHANTLIKIRQYPDGDDRHALATALTRALNAIAECFNSRDLDRLAEAVSREHAAIFADDRAASSSPDTPKETHDDQA